VLYIAGNIGFHRDLGGHFVITRRGQMAEKSTGEEKRNTRNSGKASV
jgi:hypothetical protein